MDSEGFHSYVEDSLGSPGDIVEAPLTPISPDSIERHLILGRNLFEAETRGGKSSLSTSSDTVVLAAHLPLQFEEQMTQARNEIDYWRQRSLREKAICRRLNDSVRILSAKLNRIEDAENEDSELRLLRELDELREDLAGCRRAGLVAKRLILKRPWRSTHRKWLGI